MKAVGFNGTIKTRLNPEGGLDFRMENAKFFDVAMAKTIKYSAAGGAYSLQNMDPTVSNIFYSQIS